MNIVSEIIVPIVASVIGGLLTLIGVIITIKNQNKKYEEEKKLSLKPYFYACNPHQIIEGLDKADVYDLISQDKEDGEYKIEGIIKNTENAILILESVRIGIQYYYPKYGKIIDKNKLFYLYIYPKKISEDIVLTVTDVLDNKYYYKLICSSDRDKVYSIENIKEIIWG